jgi:hypothetical protein
MRQGSRARILGITSTQETCSEEDGVDNRSEPQGWLADGSPDGTDPQDAEQATTVRTAVSAPDAEPADFSPDTAFSADPGFGADTGYSDAGFGPVEGAAEQPSSHANGGYGFGNGSSSSANGGAGSATVPAGWASDAGADPAPAPSSGAPAGFSGYDAYGASPAASAFAASAAPAAAPPGPAPGAARAAASPAGSFPAPTSVRPKPPRAGGKTASPPRPAAAASRPGTAAMPGTSASTRRAQLTVSRIEPWSVMKFSFMISLVGWVILFVAVAVLYFLLSKLGVFTSIENTVGLVTAGKDHPGTDASSWFSASRVLGYTMLAGAVNVILITALATVGSVLYNLVTLLAGGIEVTLKETE